MRPLTINIAVELLERLRYLAEQRKISINCLVREFVTEAVGGLDVAENPGAVNGFLL